MSDDIVPGAFCWDGSPVRRICWYCGHWTCPNFFDLDSHLGSSGCAGSCNIHPGRHEADATCPDWSLHGDEVKPIDEVALDAARRGTGA